MKTLFVFLLSMTPLATEPLLVQVPKLTRGVMDFTNTLNKKQIRDLGDRLAVFEKRSNNQIVVLIVHTTQPETIQHYSERVEQDWMWSRKDDSGRVLLLIAKNDRKLRIKVSSVLEDSVSHASMKRIIQKIIIPKFKKNQYYEGIWHGVDSLILTIKGDNKSKRANSTDTQNNEIENIEAIGNLESVNPVKCVDISSLNNKNTPADIFIGVTKCIKKGNYNAAGLLYYVALTYGRYDTKRVVDKTAHQAISVLRLNHLGGLSKKKTQKLRSTLKKYTTNREPICKSLIKLGKPGYHPSYMIQHGMGAFRDNKSTNGIVANFNSNEAWKGVLTNYVKCSK